jgi:hypothetical protein
MPTPTSAPTSTPTPTNKSRPVDSNPSKDTSSKASESQKIAEKPFEEPTTVSDTSDPVSGQIYVTKKNGIFRISIETSRANQLFYFVGTKKDSPVVNFSLVTDRNGDAKTSKSWKLSGYKLTLIYSDTSATVDTYKVK